MLRNSVLNIKAMAKQKEGVYEKIIDCAKTEFLEKGFKDASLRMIAKNAQTSTSSIYTRFHDKEGLFDAIVNPVIEAFQAYFRGTQQAFHEIDPSQQDAMKYDYAGDCMNEMIDYIYNHLDEFKLLLKCSYGTGASDFIEGLVETEVDYTLKFIEITGNDAIAKGRANRPFLHIITKAYFTGFFEIVLHDMNKADAKRYVQQLRDFYSAGHETIYHPEKIELK